MNIFRAFRTKCGLAKAFGVGVRCVFASLFRSVVIS
jgi:hypothetical protein